MTSNTEYKTQYNYKESTNEGDLNNWRTITLGDCGNWLGGGTPSKKNKTYWENGTIPWASSQDITTNNLKNTKYKITEKAVLESTANIVPKDAIIMVMRSGVLRRRFPVTKTIQDTAINQDLKAIVPFPEFDRDFLFYILKNNEQNILQKCVKSGTTVESVEFRDLKKLKFKVPNLEEQKQISAILSLWEMSIELKAKLIQQKKEQKKGLMQKLLMGEVRLPGFHKEWKKRKIGELIVESKVVADEPDLNKRITVRLNLKGVQKREVTAVEKEGATIQYVRKAGQFIYGKQNLHKGAIGLVPKELDGFQSSSDIPSFDFKSGVDGLWFYYFFSRESFYSYLEVISTGTGSKRINPKDLFKIKINVPPFEEQRRISEILLCQDKEIKLHEKELKELKEQKKGLMQLLLTGKVRVQV